MKARASIVGTERSGGQTEHCRDTQSGGQTKYGRPTAEWKADPTRSLNPEQRMNEEWDTKMSLEAKYTAEAKPRVKAHS